MAPRGRKDEKTLDDGFLSRWSARKHEARREDEEAVPAAEASETTSESQPDNAATGAEEPAFDPKDLPDIDSLDKESDFSVFMHEKVPEALRRRALRRLWRVNPVFSHLDGMNDYDEDYTDAALVVEGLKTVYQVGKGMLVEDEEPKPAGAGESESDAPDAADGDPAVAQADADPQEADAVEEDNDPQDAALAAAPDDPGGQPIDALAGTLTESPEPAREVAKRSGKNAFRRRWGEGDG